MSYDVRPQAVLGQTAAGYARPAGNPAQSRSAVVARHGMVATSEPLAALAGLEVLKQGGSAADAAIAVNAMLGLTEPMSCGIGGDLFVLYWDAKTQKLYGLNASGRSPAALNRQVFRELQLEQIPPTGPLSWSVPGCVDGWCRLQEKFGRRTLAENLAPAIAYAEEGFAVSQIIAASWQGGAEALRAWPDSAETYLPGGRAPREGEVFRNPRLAATYRRIAQHGRDGFYRGHVAEQLVAASDRYGGRLALSDLAEHTSDWVEPVSTNYRGYDVWELPPNGQGIAALQMLNLLEPTNLKELGFGSADYVHLLVEAKKLAYADRAKFYADPAFEKLPVAELISKQYAAQRRKQMNPARALASTPPGNPHLETGDTVYITVVDRDRNCCSFIQSLFHSFGSKVAAGDTGFVVQNRGCLFALEENHLNRLEPRKRPFHTIIPAMATKDGKPWLCFGVMGGDMQPQGHVQVLINLIDFGMNVQEAGDAARVNHFGSATPTGLPEESGGGLVAVEPGIGDDTIAELRRRGHKVVRAKGSFGGYQAILIDWENGTLHGGTDPRKDGCAIGY